MPFQMQQRFSGGEIAEQLFARTDIELYSASLARERNFFSHIHGGVSNRPGFEFIGFARSDSDATRLIPFEFNTTDTYVLEFSSGAMRVIRNGGYVLVNEHAITDISNANPAVVESSNHDFVQGQEIHISGVNGMSEINGKNYKLNNLQTTTVTITGITQAEPAVVSATAHGLVDGQMVYISGVVGMTQVNGKFFRVANANANDFALTDSVGNDVDSSGYGAYVSDGTAVRKTFELQARDETDIDSTLFGIYGSGGDASQFYTLDTPYDSADLANLKYTQTADLMTLVHPDYAPRELARFGHANWTMTPVSFVPKMGSPTGVAAVPSSTNQGWEAGTIVGNNWQDGVATPGTITNIIQATEAAIEIQFSGNKPGVDEGDTIYLSGIPGMVEVNNRDENNDPFGYVLGKRYNVGSNRWGWPLKSVDGSVIDSSGYTAYSASAVVFGANISVAAIAVVTVVGHGFSNEQRITIDKLTWATDPTAGDANGDHYIRYVDDDTFELYSDVDLATPVVTTDGVDPANGEIVTDGGTFGKRQFRYKATAISKETGEESLPTDASLAKAGDPLDGDRPCYVSWSAPTSGNVRHYNVYKEDAGAYGFVGESETTSFRDDNIEPDFGRTPPQKPTRNPFEAVISDITIGSTTTIHIANGNPYANGNRVRIDGILESADPTEFNEQLNGKFFLVKNSMDTSFEITALNGEDIDTSSFTSTYTANSGVAADYPGAVSYFNQRRGFAQQFNTRQAVHWSTTGLPSNFNRASAGSSSTNDAFSYTVDSLEVSEIRHIVPMRNVFLFTSGSVMSTTVGDNAFALENIQNREQTVVGASQLRPIKTKNSVLYVQDLKSKVWDLTYSFESDGFVGQELTVLTPHLIEENTILDWTYADSPDSLVWVVFSDGTLGAITYDKANRISGWSVHETDGEFESVTSVPEGNEHAVYVVVRRTIEGADRRMVERLHTRKFAKANDAFFVDSGLTFDNPLEVSGVDTLGAHVQVSILNHDLAENDQFEIDDVVGSTELNLNHYRAAQVSSGAVYLAGRYLDPAANITGITQANPAVVTTASAHGLSDGDPVYVSNVVGMTDVNDTFYVVANGTSTSYELSDFAGLAIDSTAYTAYTSGGTYEAGSPVPASGVSAYVSGGKVRNTVSTVGNLDHLEGKQVAVLNDGNVEPLKTVADGSVALEVPGARVHVGLPYSCQLKTLPLDTPDSQLAKRNRDMVRVVAKLHKTQGFKAGPSEALLTDYPARENENWDDAAQLITGEIDMPLAPLSDTRGQIIVQQDDPLPITVQGIGFEFEVSDE